MEIVGDQRVGKTFWVRFRLLRVDPLTLEETPEEAAQAGYVQVIRPNGTDLALKELDAGLNHLGGGWYAAHFTPDASGRHTIRVAAQATGGLFDRELEDIVIFEG